MWNAEVVNLLSDISDSFGVLTDIPEAPAEVFGFRAFNKYHSEIAQKCLQIYAFETCENRFYLRLSARSPRQ